jgi:hypothetical protein
MYLVTGGNKVVVKGGNSGLDLLWKSLVDLSTFRW